MYTTMPSLNIGFLRTENWEQVETQAWFVNLASTSLSVFASGRSHFFLDRAFGRATGTSEEPSSGRGTKIPFFT
jgi:hypothetical protein